MSESDLFIVDNSDNDWKVLRYLHDFCDLSRQIDIATGYFDIGALLALKDEWQKVDKIRILMGDEVSRRTFSIIAESYNRIQKMLDKSLDDEKIKNDFLEGVDAITQAISAGKIECRVFKKDKFHAKAYITHGRSEIIGSRALVGSSNFTKAGLQDNVELNVQVTSVAEVSLLQSWYDSHWEQAEDCSPDILRIIERHSRDYLPFDVWAKSLSEYLQRDDLTIGAWERTESKIFPHLADYQRDGYQGLLNCANKHGGAFLCDGVGLGKTFIGMMLIERFLLHRGSRKGVALFVPKAAREAVWEKELDEYLPNVLSGFLLPFKIFNHTDLHRTSLSKELESVKNDADVIIIDEAHNFRNRGRRSESDPDKRSRYFRMREITEGKQVFMLTATPINNRLLDFKHLIDLFSQEQPGYFAGTLGIPSLDGYFRRLDMELAQQMGEVTEQLDLDIAKDFINERDLFKELVIQRSRSYVKESISTTEAGKGVLFPTRNPPKVANYSVTKSYGNLLDKIETAFDKEYPLFILSIYNPYRHYSGDLGEVDNFTKVRQTQVVSLIRLGFLKRFESSARAFEMSCRTLLLKLLAWIDTHNETDDEKARLEKWISLNLGKGLKYLEDVQSKLFSDSGIVIDDEEMEEDTIPPEFLDRAADKRLNPQEFDISALMNEAYDDLDNLIGFIGETSKIKPENDDKLVQLKKLLNSKDLQGNKVLIFTEFKSTARYIANELKNVKDIGEVAVVDSTTKENRASIVERFSPYYNRSSSSDLVAQDRKEIRILVSTDVLAEGLNLQDATRLINYDIHWNPVRLMQRIGRIDRRLSHDKENKIISDHPKQKSVRGKVAYWNFLPPQELDRLLRLHKRVSSKTLRISKVLGIEGGQLLGADDDFADLKTFDSKYEGEQSQDERLRLEYKRLIADHPDLPMRIKDYPSHMFSGKETPNPHSKGVFFCYGLPAPRRQTEQEKEQEKMQQKTSTEVDRWNLAEGKTRWYFYDFATDEITTHPEEIADLIRSKPDTPRHTAIEKPKLVEIRKKIESYIKKDYFRKMDAPAGVKAKLIAWMEIN